MKVSYYPGCALHGTSLEYDESTQAIGRMLGVELCELPDWNCCGASSAHVTDESLALSLPARNLAIAEAQGMDLVIPCAACYGRVKGAEKEMLARRGTAAPQQSFRVLNLLDFIGTSDLSEKIRALLKRPLKGLKVVCYYGCLLVRPPKVTGTRNFENPEEMDRLMELLGAKSIPWSYKTDCCGADLAMTHGKAVKEMVGKIVSMAKEAGAQCIVTSCGLCQMNLEMRQDQGLPILYFTEWMGVAFDVKNQGKWLKKHLISPKGLLESLGLA